MSDSRVRGLLALTISWLALTGMSMLMLFDIVNGPWNLDSGWYLLRASLVANGSRPYLEYSTIYPPLMDLLHAIPIAMGVDRYLVAIAIPYLWNIANAAASAVLARSLGFSAAASLTAATGFLVLSVENEGNHVTLEHGVVFFSLAAIISVVKGRGLGRGRLFVCGVSLACAVLSKQNGLVAMLPVAAILFERRHQLDRGHFASLAAGFMLPFLLLLAYLDFQFRTIYHETFDKLFEYAGRPRESLPSFQWEFDRSRPTAVFLPSLAGIGLLAIAAGPRRRLATVALAATAVQLLPRLVRLYAHYTLNAWPFALLIVLIAGSSVAIDVRRLTKFVCVTIVGASILTFVLSPYRWTKPGELPSLFRPAAMALRSVSDENEELRLYSSEQIIPFLADRLPDHIEIMTNDDSYLAPFPLAPGIPAVLVDRGGDWVPPLRRRLEWSGFSVVFDARGARGARVTVYDRAVQKHPRRP